MKTCGACLADLPKAAYSKKQWQAKVFRRCKECIAANRDICERGDSDNEPVLMPNEADEDERWAREREALAANAEPAGSVDEGALFEQPPPTEDCGECF